MDAEQLKAQGWFRLPTVRYSEALGPTWARVRDGVAEVGLEAREHLANDSFGMVHGGAIMTFADMALGFAVGYAIRDKSSFGGPESAPFVTAQLQVQFTAAGKVGSFIVARPEVVRKTSQLVFLRTLIEAEGRTIASADGIFKLLDTEKIARLKAG
ncbi:MAG: PaaI family thioesterase [Novosphingobium sp.]